MTARLDQRPTRSVSIGALRVGGDAPIVVQSMCATKTRDIDATVAQCEQLHRADAERLRALGY